MKIDSIIRPEVEVEPLGDIMLNFLIDKDREEPYLDFKETLDIRKTSSFAKIAKDFFAFSNYGGGFILIGFKEKAKMENPPEDKKVNFLPLGLPADYHIDQSDLQPKFNSYSNVPIEIGYREFLKNIGGTEKKFAAIYVPASTCVLTPIKDGVYVDEKGKTKRAFETGSVMIRRGTQSLPATDEEEAWIKKKVFRYGI